MATLRDIKRRIKGVQSTQQITKAMKMVAAARLRKAQEGIVNARPYARKISLMLSHLITDTDLASNPYLSQREVKNVCLVVVTADRGLCGAFNTNIIKEAARYVQQNEDEGNIQIQLYCVGKKGFDYFSKRNFKLLGSKLNIFAHPTTETAVELTNELIQLFFNGTVDKIVLVYNEFKSIIQQKIIFEDFLPIPLSDESKTKNEAHYILEHDQQSIFNFLLPRYIRAQMWRVFLESYASELGARMTAMDNATTNAKELIRSLNIKYNKERQASITKEIIEIVSGANALRSN
ncbi:MAG: ATP synthase F1 subunit gamma [Ignavibacteriaceae bacterium]|nr:ATP synthase F1 subunit gamma [Ignavibacteriaceae bacterium]